MVKMLKLKIRTCHKIIIRNVKNSSYSVKQENMELTFKGALQGGKKHIKFIKKPKLNKNI